MRPCVGECVLCVGVRDGRIKVHSRAFCQFLVVAGIYVRCCVGLARDRHVQHAVVAGSKANSACSHGDRVFPGIRSILEHQRAVRHVEQRVVAGTYAVLWGMVVKDEVLRRYGGDVK